MRIGLAGGGARAIGGCATSAPVVRTVRAAPASFDVAMTPESRQRALVLRAQSGDREAFDALLRDLAPPLLRYLSRVLGEIPLAEDVLQETFLAIVRKIGWLHDPALFKAWAYRIASREAMFSSRMWLSA